RSFAHSPRTASRTLARLSLSATMNPGTVLLRSCTFCFTLASKRSLGDELREGGAMSADAPKTKLTEPSIPHASPYGLAMPTGYRVSIVPGAVEVSARLVTPEEIRNLIKVLQAGLSALESTTDGDMDAPMTFKPAAKVGTGPR